MAVPEKRGPCPEGFLIISFLRGCAASFLQAATTAHPSYWGEKNNPKGVVASFFRAGDEWFCSHANAAAISSAGAWGRTPPPSFPEPQGSAACRGVEPGAVLAFFACECPAFLGGLGRAEKNPLYSRPETTQRAS